MNKVSVAILKEKLSYYLKLVQEGQEITVTSYRSPVARILPASQKNGIVRLPTRPVSDLRKVKGLSRKRILSAVEELLQDRKAR